MRTGLSRSINLEDADTLLIYLSLNNSQAKCLLSLFQCDKSWNITLSSTTYFQNQHGSHNR